jgi:hypothetical protein
MHIKTTMRYYFTPTRVTAIRKVRKITHIGEAGKARSTLIAEGMGNTSAAGSSSKVRLSNQHFQS